MYNLNHYDYIIIGAGLAGCVAARELTDRGAKCLVVEKRDHIGGNCASYMAGDIEVHKYGPHIFHTNKKELWDYVNRFDDWNEYYHQVKSLYNNKMYDFPPNINVLKDLCNTIKATPKAKKKIYEAFFEGYTAKAWFNEKPPFDPMARIPIKITTDNHYWPDTYQGLPGFGYDNFFNEMLTGIDRILGVTLQPMPFDEPKIIMSGRADDMFNCSEGVLKFKGVRFDTNVIPLTHVQGFASLNFAKANNPSLRQMEWKYFTGGTVEKTDYTVITNEYADKKGEDYPYPTKKYINMHKKYAEMAEERGIVLIGRLGLYRYMNMDQTIESTLEIIGNL